MIALKNGLWSRFTGVSLVAMLDEGVTLNMFPVHCTFRCTNASAVLLKGIVEIMCQNNSFGRKARVSLIF